jgi:hypothetical protein
MSVAYAASDCVTAGTEDADSFRGLRDGLFFREQLDVTLIELQEVARGLMNFLSTLILSQETIEITGVNAYRRINDLVANILGGGPICSAFLEAAKGNHVATHQIAKD